MLALWLALALSSDGGVGGTVRLEISGVRSREGHLRCALFRVEREFPEGLPEVAQKFELASVSGASCVFTDVPAGTWAATVHHDLNRDGKIDKTFFGMPTEGYGISNNHTYATHGPRWAESTFTVTAGETKTLEITLRN